MTEVEQYTDESREALTTATERLIDTLRRHTDYLLGLRGGTAELAGLFDQQQAMNDMVASWNEAVSDHTGTSAVYLIDDDDDEDEDDDDEEEAVQAGELISVVSRFDLVVTDPDAALESGRKAHRRMWPDENDEDTEAAVGRVVDALYSVGHEAGEPWFELPGVEPAGGIRLFVAVEEHQPFEPDDDEFPVPGGTTIRSESWSFF